MQEKASYGPLPWQRLIVLTGAALVLYLLCGWLRLASPSERFHATVPLLWLVDVLYYQRHRRDVRWSYVIIGILGAGLGLLAGLWLLLAQQARALGGTVDWREIVCELYFVASIFVLYSVLCALLTQLIGVIPGARATLAAPHGWWLRYVRMSLAIILFVPYLFTTFNIHRFKSANATNPKLACGLPYEEVKFAATDGVALSGWFIPAKQSRATVLVCHGVGANKGNFLGIVPFLHRASFNVFLFDFRGHGDSAGHTISFGYYEARDVRGAVDYLLRRRDSGRILAYAFSMGGSALLHAMPHLPEVRGVVVDSTFAEMAPLARQQMALLPWGLDTAMFKATDFYTRLEIGIHASAITPRRYIGGISPRPLLIIHGLADKLIPPTQAKSNYAAARRPKELWLVNGADHCACRAVAEALYERRVAAFLRRCVRRNEPRNRSNRAGMIIEGVS